MDFNEVRSEAIKATPAVGVTGLSVLGVSLQDWVYVATFIYILTQTAVLLFRTWRKYKAKEPPNDV